MRDAPMPRAAQGFSWARVGGVCIGRCVVARRASVPRGLLFAILVSRQGDSTRRQRPSRMRRRHRSLCRMGSVVGGTLYTSPSLSLSGRCILLSRQELACDANRQHAEHHRGLVLTSARNQLSAGPLSWPEKREEYGERRDDDDLERSRHAREPDGEYQAEADQPPVDGSPFGGECRPKRRHDEPHPRARSRHLVQSEVEETRRAREREEQDGDDDPTAVRRMGSLSQKRGAHRNAISSEGMRSSCREGAEKNQQKACHERKGGHDVSLLRQRLGTAERALDVHAAAPGSRSASFPSFCVQSLSSMVVVMTKLSSADCRRQYAHSVHRKPLSVDSFKQSFDWEERRQGGAVPSSRRRSTHRQLCALLHQLRELDRRSRVEPLLTRPAVLDRCERVVLRHGVAIDLVHRVGPVRTLDFQVYMPTLASQWWRSPSGPLRADPWRMTRRYGFHHSQRRCPGGRLRASGGQRPTG